MSKIIPFPKKKITPNTKEEDLYEYMVERYGEPFAQETLKNYLKNKESDLKVNQ